jgi:hypothetical protein
LPPFGREDMVRAPWFRQFGARVSDIFREIDEELRRDNLLKLWSKYGRYLLALAAAALVIAGAVVAWRQHQLAERLAQSTRYAQALALAREGKEADAARIFGVIAQEGGGYAVLARLEDAAMLAKSGDRKGAVATYDRIAATAGQPFADLARLSAAMADFPDADPNATIERLAPLTEPGNPWRPSALELTAAARLKEGDRKAALEIYRQLADDPTTPQSLRGRAAEMAAALAP